MRVLTSDGHRGARGLALAERPAQPAGPGEVTVRVAAAGLNRADLLQSLGRYPAPAGTVPDVPGLEFSGTVTDVGAHVSTCGVGDRVMGLLSGGAFSEQLTCDARLLLQVPESLSLVDAAAFPEAFATAWDAVTRLLELAPGDRLLVTAAASGVGSAALQLGVMRGAQVTGTTRSAENAVYIQALGATPLCTAAPNWLEVLDAEPAPTAVVDLVGGALLPDILPRCAPRGRVALVGLLGGTRATLDLSVVLGRQLRLMGTTLRQRPIAEKAALLRALGEQVLPALGQGRLSPSITARYSFSQAPEAFDALAGGHTRGKTVLVWD